MTHSPLYLLGSALLLVAPTLFIIGSLKKEGTPGKIDPNPAMFFIRSVTAWLNLTTYFVGSKTDWVRCSILIVSSVSLSVLFLLSIILGRWRMVRMTEVICLVLAGLVGYIWKLTADPVLANLLMQGILVISFIPSWVGTYRLTERQTSLTWAFATAAYVCMTIAVVTDPVGFKLFQLVNPIVPGIGGNGLLALLAYRQEKMIKNGISTSLA